jgi:multidrug efflux system membrane fusion protein
MQLKPQYLFVVVVVGVVALYFIVRSLLGIGHSETAQAKTAPPAGAPSVQVKLVPEVQRQYDLVVRGRTQATRTVVVRSETAGVVSGAPVLQGTAVKQGEVLCRLAVDARQASLDQARAAKKSAELTQQQNSELAKKGFRSPTQVLQAQASLDASTAAVRQAEIALAQVNIKAPFAGVFDHRDAEVGTYLAPGQPCGTMIELNPLLVVGDVPETEAASLKARRPRRGWCRARCSRAASAMWRARPTRRPGPIIWKSPSRIRTWESARAYRPRCISARAQARRT